MDETSAQEAREKRRQQLKEAAEVAKRLAVNERTTHRQAEKTAQKASAAKAGHAAAAAVSSSESEDDDLGDDDDDDVLVDTAAKGKGKGTVPLGVQRLIKELERARAKAVREAKETAANTALTPPQQTSEVFEVRYGSPSRGLTLFRGMSAMLNSGGRGTLKWHEHRAPVV